MTFYRVEKYLKGHIRSRSEASKLFYKKNPKKGHPHTEEFKQKMRTIRLAYLATHKSTSTWRKDRERYTYPEECFANFLERHGYDKKYLIVKEHPFYPYFIDFAFINEKLAVEIDGTQHLLEERKLKDEKKDAALKADGWRVLRVTAKTAINQTETIKPILDKLLNSSTSENIDTIHFGILPHSYYKQKKKEEIENYRRSLIESANIDYKNEPYKQIGKLLGVNWYMARRYLQYHLKDIYEKCVEFEQNSIKN